MYPVPGHIAISLLGNRYLKADWIPVIAGCLLPDLIDKPLNDIFLITPHGRCAMHSFLGLVLTTTLFYFASNWKTAYSYMIGHFSHLVADADFNPWFWPFIDYKFPAGIDVLDLLRVPGTILFPGWILLETLILGLVLFLYTRYSEKRSIQATVLITIAALSVYRITRQRPDTIFTGQ